MLLAACASASESSGGQVDAAAGDDAATQPNKDAAQPGADAPAGGCANAFTGTLATWDFSGEPGTQASTAAASTATGVSAGAVTRSAALTAVSGANAINSSNWPIAAQPDATKYYAMTLTAPAACTLSITSLAIDAKASGTGPTMAGVGSSLDSFAQLVGISTSAPSTAAMALGDTATIELRVFGYAASGTAGTLRLQTTLSVVGSVH